MGTTTNFFKAGLGASAGATLGNIAVSSGCQLIASSFAKANQKAYLNYKANIYDNIVRKDIVEFYASDGKWLPTYSSYPFFEAEPAIAKQNLFLRHPVLSVLLLITILGNLFIAMGSSSTPSNMIAPISLSSFALFIGVIYTFLKKTGRKTVNTVTDLLANDAREELRHFGQEYWQVREYVKDALASGHLDDDSAYRELLDTFLVQQLPDKNSQLRALAYNRKKELNLL